MKLFLLLTLFLSTNAFANPPVATCDPNVNRGASSPIYSNRIATAQEAIDIVHENAGYSEYSSATPNAPKIINFIQNYFDKYEFYIGYIYQSGTGILLNESIVAYDSTADCNQVLDEMLFALDAGF